MDIKIKLHTQFSFYFDISMSSEVAFSKVAHFFPLYDSYLCLFFLLLIITALHGMYTRSSDENSVSLFVGQMHELLQNGGKSFQIFITYERSFSLVFREKEWLVGVTPAI